MRLHRGSGWHNGAVMTSKLTPVATVALVCSMALTGCGGDKKATSDTTPTAHVDTASGVTLTKPGERLTFGERATVAYEPNSTKKSILELTVVKVEQAAIAELGSYQLDDVTKTSTPFYVTVNVTNVGDGDVGGADVPIYLVDSADTLVQSSSFTNRFAPCPSTNLPANFAPQAKTTTCLLYLVPASASYREVSFRPVQDVAPIVWEGNPGTSAALTQKAHKAQKSKKAKR